MQIPARYKYMVKSDKELVEAITRTPPDEHAAVYLLYERYTPKFKKLYAAIYQNTCMETLLPNGGGR